VGDPFDFWAYWLDYTYFIPPFDSALNFTPNTRPQSYASFCTLLLLLPLRHLSLFEPFALLRFYTLSIKYPL
jgi:hypothetical protein